MLKEDQKLDVISNVKILSLTKRVQISIFITSEITESISNGPKMGPRKNRHPPKFSLSSDYETYRDALMRWIETANYPLEEKTSMIALGLRNNNQGMPRDKCLADIGDSPMGKRGLFKLIEWMDLNFNNGWIEWLNNARKDPECYVASITILRLSLSSQTMGA